MTDINRTVRSDDQKYTFFKNHNSGSLKIQTEPRLMKIFDFIFEQYVTVI